MGGAGIQPDVDIHLNQVGGNNPDPIRPSFNPACIAKFVGFFHKSNSNSATILPQKSYAQALSSQPPDMNRRDGFGGGRMGRGAGRTGARGNVWQRVQGRGQVEEGLMMIETSSGTREIGSGSVMKVEEILMAETLGSGIAIVALLPTGIELRGLQIRRRSIWRGTSKRIKIWRSLLNQRYFLSETLR